MAKWYDYPQYFDMLFRDETPVEVEFFEAAFERFAKCRVKRLLEPGCGSGRLVVALAAKGYDVTGIDLSPAMLKYTERKLKRRQLHATCVLGDMTSIEAKKPYHAAFCTYNTFRHLLTEKDAVTHLQTLADAIAPGGLYILGMHLTPEEEYDAVTERFTIKHAGTELKTTISVPETDEKKRLETLRVKLVAKRKSGDKIKIESEFPLRLYTPTQLKRLFKKVSDRWELVESFDFAYDIDDPLPFDSELLEGLFVLRRKG
ncbi:class I SAM-dependent methyltransferase [Rhodopirellula sp. MGV]|uniref:class I SAM-dependent methyltransferase n=1 Tax=Rhodopirellula sp. MGV TaxID=2023130 RepID=UPI000B965846|nr:class I SAM-dependent methyltransferase [Rhodopirellula sp. MGV]OYP31101.1 SAM-dependent methyltransferase [Rhodopirellula sp. MGV]PNY37474.1 class I SAM-dependent methyltransferase [Rhodopirellula baltica]